MQMDEKKPSVPKLRFPGFTDPWEQRKLGDLIEINSGRDYKHLENGGIPVYGTGGLLAYVNEALSYKKDAVGIGRKGTIDHPYKLKAPFWTVDTLFYAVPSSQADLDFVLGLFHRINWKSKDESTGLPSLSKKIINSVPIMAPLFQEQQKIGKALSYCDSLITLHQRKLEHLREMKRGLLQKMFPKDGESAPELRFPGFTDPWEQRKLGEVFEEYSDKGHPEQPALTIIQGGGTVPRSESDRQLQYDKSNLSSYKLVNMGDFILHLRSFEGGLELATRTGIVSPAYHIFHGKETDSIFYYSFFHSPSFIDKELSRHVYGIRDGRSVDVSGMKTIQIPRPSIEEQREISAFIGKFDSLITLHQRKLEHLQEMKKGLLQQMFV